jgi:hypothetical protein
MLSICLIFITKSQPPYGYRHYAYQKTCIGSYVDIVGASLKVLKSIYSKILLIFRILPLNYWNFHYFWVVIVGLGWRVLEYVEYLLYLFTLSNSFSPIIYELWRCPNQYIWIILSSVNPFVLLVYAFLSNQALKILIKSIICDFDSNLGQQTNT